MLVKLIVLLLNFIFAYGVNRYSQNNTGCANRVFLGCILQLKEEHIQFDRNIVRVILGINSEAKLLHTCKTYTNALPCFRDKVLDCGNDQQRELFAEVGRALMFLCSPFSLTRQRVLIRQNACIAKVLSLPISAGCKLNKKPYGEKLESCKRHCATMPKNFTCSLKTWITEQNACTLNDIAEQCSYEAADFYSDLQASIFEPTYPFVCQKEDRIQTSTANYLITNPPASSKTEISDLFTKTQLSTKKPNKPSMFYISPRLSIQTNSTPKPMIRITPDFFTTKTPKTSNIPIHQTQSPNQSDRLKTVSAAHATLIVLLQKLLPLALRSNLTSLLNHKNELIELSRRLDFKTLLQNSTKETRKLPQHQPENNNQHYLTAIHVIPTTQLPITSKITFMTVKNVTPTKANRQKGELSTIVESTTESSTESSITQNTWRPWYFAVSSDNDN